MNDDVSNECVNDQTYKPPKKCVQSVGLTYFPEHSSCLNIEKTSNKPTNLKIIK